MKYRSKDQEINALEKEIEQLKAENQQLKLSTNVHIDEYRSERERSVVLQEELAEARAELAEVRGAISQARSGCPSESGETYWCGWRDCINFISQAARAALEGGEKCTSTGSQESP